MTDPSPSPRRPTPPVAPRRPEVLHHRGHDRVDDWFWLRERDNPEVEAYLRAENDYTAAALAHLEPLQAQLFEEIRGRVRETDVSAPVRKGAWEYYRRTVEGLQYAVHCRRPAGTPDAPQPDSAPGTEPSEVVVLDENLLAGDSPYFALGGFALSPDGTRLAYATDLTGAERYTLRIRDLPTATDLPDVVPDTYYGLAWSADGATIYAVRPDEMVRPYQVIRHRLGTDPATDAVVFEEADERYYVSVESTRTERLVLVTSASKLTTEVWTLDARDPEAEPALVAARDEGVEYHVEHHVGADGVEQFFVLTNADSATNFQLMVTDVASPGRSHWRPFIPHRAEVRFDDVHAFVDHLVFSQRLDGLTRLEVHRLADGETHSLVLPDEVYSVGVGSNPEFDTRSLRFDYTSPVTPPSNFDYDLDTRAMTLVKQQVVAGYDAARFETHRLWATASDGTRVPISVVHERQLPRDGRAPMLLYGYGSYEISIDPSFSIARLSLLERGYAFAIAHIRGGGEMGRAWYDGGKLLHKRNTFTDFIACADHLIHEGYTSAARLAIRGGSAGGLLMGAVVNLRPELFRAAVAEVPFVDCLTTILDPSLPLTVTEWEEWGNPVTNDAVYDYMLGYSPYDNVAAVPYPALLVTAGLNDPRVQYWEPAKWVAKLRATKTDDRVLLLKTEMDAGHSGPSGRYDAWRDEAFVLSFILDQTS